MFRKRIEIIYCLMVGLPALALHAPVGASETPGIGRLWTTQSFPVEASNGSEVRQLPPLPGVDEDELPGEDAAAYSGQEVDYAGQEALEDADRRRDIHPSYFWDLQDGLHLRIRGGSRPFLSRHSPGLLSGFELPQFDTPGTRWQPRPSGGGWQAAVARWNTRLDGNAEISLGNSEFFSTQWEDSLRLSGISLSQSILASDTSDPQWKYSFALGAVDLSATGANDLQFGPAAGAMSLNYDYSERLSLAARTEVASDLFLTGISSQYDFGALGRWRSSVARSQGTQREGWRYRAMADVDLMEDVTLGWMGERHTEDFLDVRRHAAGANPVAGARHKWSASWDVGRWGEWSGSFETARNRDGLQQRRFGLMQQFWYSPRLRVGIHAEREVVADDYDIGLRFSFPLY